MKAKTCGLSDEQKLRRRLHYCGTCKTMGALYGQKTRFLLNHDTVFLAEILTALGDDKFTSWQRAYQSYNCMSLPKNEMPFALEFAATANVVLTEFKLKDHIADENKTRWQIAYKTFSNAFTKAVKQLESRQFPLENLREVLAEQTGRETELTGKSPDEVLHYLAEPTATATALFFAEGAKQIGRETEAETMSALGFAFGKLVYLLDAFEDYEKDLKLNRFNAFRAAFGIDSKRLTGTAKRKAVEKIRAAQTEVAENIEKLTISTELKQLYIGRLKSNLERQLKTDLPVNVHQKVCTPKRRLTFAERWRKAKTIAGELTTGSFSQKTWQYFPAFAVVALIALIAPQEAAKAKSWQDCAGLGFNLMFLGALVGAVIAFPLKMAANLPPDIVAKAAEKAEKKRREGWCDTCCGDCGECCVECSCESCCSCDWCNCCDGCSCCDCNCDCGS